MSRINGRGQDPAGHAAGCCPAALLMIDVINDLEIPEGDSLLRFAVPMAEKVAVLKQRAKRAGIPRVYVNDNFGRWQADFRAVVEHCRREGARCRQLADLLAPDLDDYYV